MSGVPTLREVAARAKVSVATASGALAGLRSVKAATRARVQAAARELGYRRNVAAAVMAAGRQRARVVERPLTLGYLVSPHAVEVRPGDFSARAAELGYGVEWVNLRGYASGAEASRVLYHRNVAGLFISAPGAVPEDPDWLAGLSWERFSVVKFSRGRPELRFPLIRHSAFDYAERTLREVFAAGYRRVAVLLTPSASAMDDYARMGAVLAWKSLRLARGEALDWKMLAGPMDSSVAPAMRRWLRARRPEAVIGFPNAIYWRLLEEGFEIPGDFAYAGIVGDSEGGRVATCAAYLDIVRHKAAEMLHQMIATGQRGMADSPSEIVIEPLWESGESLPLRASPVA
ncbi:MAG: LacI family transcriptional regulator [Terrimicrobiaceae bacterium]|nr:LacI family transcriptional regulator [Terrimicrobiaceae bacterium]